MLLRASAMSSFFLQHLLLLLSQLPLMQKHAGLCPSNAHDEQELCRLEQKIQDALRCRCRFSNGL